MAADTGRLVRNGLPAEIRATGREPVIRIADDAEYRDQLRAALARTADEAAAAKTLPGLLDRLAETVELVYAIADAAGYTPEMLDVLRAQKHAERGGFSARIIWLGNQPRTQEPAGPPPAPRRPADDDAPLVTSSAPRDYGLCQNCLKNRATMVREDTPVCPECVDRYDTGRTTGSPS